MSVSPLSVDASVVTTTITSEGAELPKTMEVLEVKTEISVNKIASALIKIRDGDTAKQNFEVADSDTFKPGAKIEIKIGYQSENDLVFSGIVVKQSIKIDQEGSQLHVECKDEAIKLTTNRKNKIGTNTTDSSFLSELIESYGLTSDISSTQVTHKEMVQFYATDWDFLISRAEINGMIVLTDNGTLKMTKPNVSNSPALELRYGYDIIEFDGEVGAIDQYSGVKSAAWDMSTQSIITATAAEPTVNEQGDLTGSTLSDVVDAGDSVMSSSVTASQESIQQWADAKLLKSRMSRFKGTITFQGSSLALVNSNIKLLGLSNRFNGNAFISGVSQTIENGQWQTEVTLGLEAEWFSNNSNVSSPLASSVLPGIKGLQTGIVKKIDSDPENQFRVEVEIPILADEGNTVWARLASFYTGNSFGSYFMPELKDEVVLGFMNDDPRYPVIIGSLYSSAIPTSETPEENNNIKSIVTRTKMKLQFDEEKKAITIETPGGNSIVISDDDKGITLKDQNSNKIQMNDSGVVVESNTNLTLKATEEVKIQGATITMTGEESLKASAGMVTVSGDETTTISGATECTVSSDGNMSVKGLMVEIN